MEKSGGRIDELRNFFLAEDRWQAMILFRIGSLGDAPALLERLGVKNRRAAKRIATVPDDNFPIRNSSPDLHECAEDPSGPGTVEPSRKIFDGVDVTTYSFFRAALVGTGDLLFQLVQFRIAENLPPVTVAPLIRRMRGLPLA